MTKNWHQIENIVRDMASIRWNRNCAPSHIRGVDFDGYIKVSDEEVILIEITKQRSLQKVREDVAKIISIKGQLALEGVIARSFIVMEDEPTDAMKEAGAQSKITVVSKDNFIKEAFDFKNYNFLRKNYSFGSAINPETGEQDNNSYVPVSYISDDRKLDYSIDKISEQLSKGNKIVLLGEYGTGKIRCTREVFEDISSNKEKYSTFSLSINLREHWGAATGIEIIAGHLKRLGLSSSIDHTMQLLNNGYITLILDGFDEVGSQTFGIKRESIRKDALSGIRDLIQSCPAGVLITGRHHYFNSNKEMYDCLGIKTKNSNFLLLHCAEEFTDDQAVKYIENIGLDCKIPNWVPKKPLMFHIIDMIDRNKAKDILANSEASIGFWSQFLDIVCERESKIHTSIDPMYVRHVLENLAKITRGSNSSLGRLSPKDVNLAYEEATGSAPDEAGLLMLSRLCTLGRIEPESPDRQFVDPIILQFLFSESFVSEIGNMKFELLDEIWIQPLDEKGVDFFSESIDLLQLQNESMNFIKRAQKPKNNQAIAEIVSALIMITDNEIDFDNITISGAEISLLTLDRCEVKNLTIADSIFHRLEFDSCKTKDKSGMKIKDSIITLATGLTSENSLPSWVLNSKTESLQSVSTSSRIKSSKLPASQKLFLSIIQKIFFQRGGGRKESSLYKGGFGQQYDRQLIDKILSLLVNDGFVERSKDNAGFIYNPKREYMARMKSIKDQLTLSNDPLWLKVLQFDK